MGRRQRFRGHYCWCCGRLRPGKRFARRGRARRVCGDCARLGPAELAYRQAVRDIYRLRNRDGVIPRKRRARFEPFLAHPNERVRSYAAEVAAEDARMREQYRRERAAEEAAELEWERRCLEELAGDAPPDDDVPPPTDDDAPWWSDGDATPAAELDDYEPPSERVSSTADKGAPPPTDDDAPPWRDQDPGDGDEAWPVDDDWGLPCSRRLAYF